jgi:hypothetical protein
MIGNFNHNFEMRFFTKKIFRVFQENHMGTAEGWIGSQLHPRSLMIAETTS